jgi:hypothetical protein
LNDYNRPNFTISIDFTHDIAGDVDAAVATIGEIGITGHKFFIATPRGVVDTDTAIEWHKVVNPAVVSGNCKIET